MKHSREVVKCMPSEIKQKDKFRCQYRTCAKLHESGRFGNTHKVISF